MKLVQVQRRVPVAVLRSRDQLKGILSAGVEQLAVPVVIQGRRAITPNMAAGAGLAVVVRWEPLAVRRFKGARVAARAVEREEVEITREALAGSGDRIPQVLGPQLA